MSEIHQVVFYPVGNGDTEQIILDNDRRILFDFRHCDKGEDEEPPEIDLKKRLKEELKQAKRDYFDVVAFTHADDDHIRGSTELFWLQHAKEYQSADRIKIRELWVPAAMIIEEAENDEQKKEFVILRQEARHRLLEGKDILVFSKPKALRDWLEPALKKRGLAANARDHLFVDAGTLVPGFDLESDKVEFFCHSPFVEHCDDGDMVRNTASLVFNVRFKAGKELFDFLETGDTKWEDMEDIVKVTRAHKNDDRLKWDLFNIPHHCSYLSLSDEKGEKETEPKPKIKELLLEGRPGSYIVSCSNPIPSTEEAHKSTQPPHIQARRCYETYLDKVEGTAFYVTMEQPTESKPEPIVFEFSSKGVKQVKKAGPGAAAIVTSVAPRAGI